MFNVAECIQYVEIKGKMKYLGMKKGKYHFGCKETGKCDSYTLKELRQAKTYLWMGV